MITVCFYYIILLSSTFWAYCAEFSGSNKRKEYCYRFLLFFTLSIPAVLREGIGTDYIAYVYLFKYADAGEIEPGFYYLCQLLKSLSLDYHWMFASISLITYAPVCFKTPRKGLGLSILFFCFLFYLNTWSLIRQGTAVCLIWWAVCLLIEEKRIKFFIVVLMAAMLHYSAFLILPFYFLRNRRLNRFVPISLIVLGVILIKFYGAIDFLFSSEALSDSYYISKYAMSVFNRETELGTGLGVAIRLLLPIYALFILPKLKETFRAHGFIAYLNIAYILAYCLSVQIHIFNRIVDYFTFVPILTAGIIAANVRSKYKSVALFVIVALNFVLFYKAIVGNASSRMGGIGIYPYESIFKSH